MSAHRTPRELINLYWEEVWNKRNVALMREICADPIVRHDANSVTELSLEDQIARVSQQSESSEPQFSHEILLADEHFVASVWNMRTRKGPERKLCGIEVFQVENGKFTRCWNSPYTNGQWGRDGDSSVIAELPKPGLISDSAQITPEWMQAVFQHAGLDMPRISLTFAEPIGEGNLSRAERVEVTYNANADNAIPSVICKYTTDIEGAQSLANVLNVYSREAAVYELFGERPPVSAPRAYLSKASADGKDLTLVLEDLSQRTRPGKQADGCSIADAKAVVTELASLHKAFWGETALQKAPWLYDRHAAAPSTVESFQAGAAVMRERFSNVVNTDSLDLVDKFTPHVGDWVANNQWDHTLIHGELRVDNVLFEDADTNVRAWLIDWQFSGLGSPMFDTAYFLSGALKQDDRASCEKEFIQTHQEHIAQADPTYTLEVATREYRASLPFGLITTVGAASVMPSNEATDAILTTLLERNVAAIFDWGLEQEF